MNAPHLCFVFVRDFSKNTTNCAFFHIMQLNLQTSDALEGRQDTLENANVNLVLYICVHIIPMNYRLHFFPLQKAQHI